MKVLVIVLVLIAVGFAATIVYGVARTQPATSTSADGRSSGPPPTTKNGDVDQDALEDWQPPDLIQAFSGIGQRFSKGIAVDRPTVTLGVNGADQRPVPSADTKNPRVAKLALTSGALAQVVAIQPGKDGAAVCLCTKGAQPTFQERSLCSARWLARQIGPQGCADDGDTNSLAFDPAGGRLEFHTLRPATVTVQ
jgi:hypothetical protein